MRKNRSENSLIVALDLTVNVDINETKDTKESYQKSYLTHPVL